MKDIFLFFIFLFFIISYGVFGIADLSKIVKKRKDKSKVKTGPFFCPF